jgi:hypothetical protein
VPHGPIRASGSGLWIRLPNLAAVAGAVDPVEPGPRRRVAPTVSGPAWLHKSTALCGVRIKNHPQICQGSPKECQGSPKSLPDVAVQGEFDPDHATARTSFRRIPRTAARLLTSGPRLPTLASEGCRAVPDCPRLAGSGTCGDGARLSLELDSACGSSSFAGTGDHASCAFSTAPTSTLSSAPRCAHPRCRRRRPRTSRTQAMWGAHTARSIHVQVATARQLLGLSR